MRRKDENPVRSPLPALPAQRGFCESRVGIMLQVPATSKVCRGDEG